MVKNTSRIKSLVKTLNSFYFENQYTTNPLPPSLSITLSPVPAALRQPRPTQLISYLIIIIIIQIERSLLKRR
ncbi:hypothetical protein HanIR_Chr13g0625331 [Helianthus annuus]|nr:hypothetical protein HanIR_Chr13g0625331 [Helianthus annuus]